MFSTSFHERKRGFGPAYYKIATTINHTSMISPQTTENTNQKLKGSRSRKNQKNNSGKRDVKSYLGEDACMNRTHEEEVENELKIRKGQATRSLEATALPEMFKSLVSVTDERQTGFLTNCQWL